MAAAHKVSFCMADIRIDAWGEKGDGPRKYYAPDCLFPVSSDGVIDHYRQGINNGWADVYDWYIPDQYIEVTGVPNGFTGSSSAPTRSTRSRKRTKPTTASSTTFA